MNPDFPPFLQVNTSEDKLTTEGHKYNSLFFLVCLFTLVGSKKPDGVFGPLRGEDDFKNKVKIFITL